MTTKEMFVEKVYAGKNIPQDLEFILDAIDGQQAEIEKLSTRSFRQEKLILDAQAEIDALKEQLKSKEPKQIKFGGPESRL